MTTSGSWYELLIGLIETQMVYLFIY